MSDNQIPERWKEHYRAATNAEHKPYLQQSQIIEELGAANAKMAEQGATIKRLRASIAFWAYEHGAYGSLSEKSLIQMGEAAVNPAESA